MGSPRYSWMVVVFPLLERIVRYCGRSQIVGRPYYIFLNLSLVWQLNMVLANHLSVHKINYLSCIHYEIEGFQYEYRRDNLKI